MKNFFQTILDAEAAGPLRLAWILTGPAAGSGAVFGGGEKDSEGVTLRYRDEAFPAERAAEILSLPSDRTGLWKSDGENGEETVFLETLPGRRKLVLCGAGHVALAVIRLAAMLGYGITVIEDREEYAGRARDAGAEQVICKAFGEALDGIGGDSSTAFVVMTREHAHDVECLRKILRKPYAYAGMMGSRSRAEAVRQQLLEEGYDPRKVSGLHMPIGLSIGSRTPEEIAVSVAAEWIQVLNAADSGEGFPEGLPEELAQGAEGVLAMIVEKSGEAPRRPGTSMLVRPDGSFRGTVGGGLAEAEILQTAGGMIREGCRESRLIRISMKKGKMHCGGEITVFLLPLKNE